MAGNSFGQAFRITTAGESHGPAYVVIIDGVPPGIALSVDDLMVDLNRRRPGQSKIVSQRDEADCAGNSFRPVRGTHHRNESRHPGPQ